MFHRPEFLQNAAASPLGECRVCASPRLEPVVDLGIHPLTGVFPMPGADDLPEGPLRLVLCRSCELLQLDHTYESESLYGENYGYRSGLNASMVRHLADKCHALERAAGLRPGDLVVDIGSNDGTFLRAFETPGLVKVGVDPAAAKFRGFYDPDCRVIADFFSREKLLAELGGDAKAALVTSIAMFYDLESPPRFVREIAQMLAPEGLWHFEQSYMPSMLRMNSYDTICHEHLEYYSFTVVRRLLREGGLKVVDVRMNAVNGGSFAVTAALESSRRPEAADLADWILKTEKTLDLANPGTYAEFQRRVESHRSELRSLIQTLRASGARIVGCGASTKGNVILGFCGLGPAELEAVSDINPDKWGRTTPGTRIPIVSEDEARAMCPDYMLVLPWHFKEGIVEREREFLRGGGRLVFPLPEIEIIGF
jgi:hypothetical protein